MIAISKKEKEAINTRFPNIHIVRTVKHKSKRHHYYCEESKRAMRFLREMRDVDGATNQKVGVKGGYRKKRK